MSSYQAIESSLIKCQKIQGLCTVPDPSSPALIIDKRLGVEGLATRD